MLDRHVLARRKPAFAAPVSETPAAARRLLPAGAWMLAGTLSGSLGLAAPALAQAEAEPAQKKPEQTVVITGHRQAPEGRDSLRATESRIGKGLQDLRDIPQSVTVLTEKLLDDRNLDTMKDALRATAGISFLAAEGGEEDIRLRGFSLQATGDVFLDGVRDPAFYERDTFNLDRLEVLRGSASMLFGRGSTGGAVNQVSKQARLWDSGQFDLSLGSHNHLRAVADVNVKTGDSSALRVNLMRTQAHNNGAGSPIDKSGLAVNFRTGVGERDEVSVSLYHLDNQNGINYGLPWIRPTPDSHVESTTVLPLPPTASYAMASDINAGQASFGTLSHVRRLTGGAEWRSTARLGRYSRDQRASAMRLGSAALQGGTAASLASFGPQTVLTRGTNLKMQTLDTINLQSDFNRKLRWLGQEHSVALGVDAAVEDKTVYAARTAAQGGVDLIKLNTTVGAPDDGASVSEDQRVLRIGSQYRAVGWGAYAQDLVQVAPHWKLLAGLRYDSLRGRYDSFAAPASAAQDNGAASRYRMNVGEWSKRLGTLYQPTARHSFHLSAATSFNTSGDAYSLGASNANTPPEQSVNLELGAKIDSADKRFSTRLALFRATKLNERNTDPLLPVVTLSGKRHVAGFEVDLAGKLTPSWEVFASYTWMPVARVDAAAPCPATGACTQGAPGERVGDRPALTPRYSGSLWSTWQANSAWRLGAGLNLRGRQTPTRAEFEVPSFAVGELMLEYTHSEALSVKTNLSNVTNKLYADQLYPGHYVPGAGRQLTVTLSQRF